EDAVGDGRTGCDAPQSSCRRWRTYHHGAGEEAGEHVPLEALHLHKLGYKWVEHVPVLFDHNDGVAVASLQDGEHLSVDVGYQPVRGRGAEGIGAERLDREGPELLAHPQLAYHAPGQRGGPLQIVLTGSRWLPIDDLLRCPAGQQHRDPAEELAAA